MADATNTKERAAYKTWASFHFFFPVADFLHGNLLDNFYMRRPISTVSVSAPIQGQSSLLATRSLLQQCRTLGLLLSVQLPHDRPHLYRGSHSTVLYMAPITTSSKEINK
ncbi:hypothetical protein HER10_EVM0002961 [Colletotrichum scovillei]|uniref:uncharacterized protein n=1 Tax=Colletotrichum scovillei TaxID=1209932 RepID=UPI0015C3B405|nr:uncharacterized protein HER10_EVM0002961 [Colletotrichum scovillei]KAF4777515.1 hypothetical protein HER10_EVM0002961 [Colletotrichum scovillei]